MLSHRQEGAMRLRYLKVDKSRHGQTRYYVRIAGRPKVRLPFDSVDDPNFLLAYVAALKGEAWTGQGIGRQSQPVSALKKPLPGSLRSLCTQYFVFLDNDPRLEPTTKANRRKFLEEVCREPPRPGSPLVLGDMPVSRFDATHVQAIIDRRVKTPEAANVRRKAISALFKWAIPRGHAKGPNPAMLAEGIRTHSEGYRTWGEPEIERFVTRHPLGTKAYLALALLLCLGQRRADVVRLGRQHMKDRALCFVQQKNEKRQHKQMRLPILPMLAEALETVPKSQMTFLQTEYGKPFTAAGFGNWFRDRCDEAGLQGYSAHGLRKGLQALGADAGLTDRELMAIAGHESATETTRYTRKRDRDLLAASGIAKLARVQGRNEIGPPPEGVGKSGPKSA
jgi:integrase